ncbi:MAG: hypothetical protein D6812_02040, partial [Deltaproteobacteria bacterium]
QDLGPHVERDMDRCIICTRCTRFMEEIANYEEYGVFFRGERTEVGAFPGKTLESNFAGNMIDVCPVGALTDKVFRFKARVYDLVHRPSICTQCSAGCNILLGTKGRHVLRVKPRENPAVNDEWICDTGRFELGWYGAGERIETPLLRKEGTLVPVLWEEAARYLAGRIGEIKERFGAQTIGGIASPTETNEGLYLFQKFFRTVVGSGSVAIPAFFGKTPAPHDLLGEAYGVAAATTSIEGIRHAPLIVLVGDRLREETPILELDIIQAVRKFGATLVLIDFPDERMGRLARYKLQTKGGSAPLIEALIGGILATPAEERAPVWQPERWEGFEALRGRHLNYDLGKLTKETGVPKTLFRELLKETARASAPLFLYAGGRQVEDTRTLRALIALSLMAHAPDDPWGGIMALYREGNLQGALDMGVHPHRLPGHRALSDAAPLEAAWGVELPKEPGFGGKRDLLEALRSLRGLYLCAETWRMEREMTGIFRELDLLVVQAMRMNEVTAHAHLVLPALSPAEQDGTVTNIERRVQRIPAAYGTPIDVLPPWESFSIFADALGVSWEYRNAESVLREMSELVPQYRAISFASIGMSGRPWPFHAPEGFTPRYLLD